MCSSCFLACSERCEHQGPAALLPAEDAPAFLAGERIMQASDLAFGAENLGMDNAG